MEENFVPLHHINVSLKDEILAVARKLKKEADEDYEKLFGASLIYASLSEYLTENLLHNLRYFLYKASHDAYSSIVYYKFNDKDQLPLGPMLKEIQKHEFPNKEEIINLIQKIYRSRNNLFHDFAKSSESELSESFIDIKIICDSAEKLVDEINSLYEGLRKLTGNQFSADLESKD